MSATVQAVIGWFVVCVFVLILIPLAAGFAVRTIGYFARLGWRYARWCFTE